MGLVSESHLRDETTAVLVFGRSADDGAAGGSSGIDEDELSYHSRGTFSRTGTAKPAACISGWFLVRCCGVEMRTTPRRLED